MPSTLPPGNPPAHHPLAPRFRSSRLLTLPLAALLATAGLASSATAGEVGVYPYTVLWGGGEFISDFSQGSKAPTGPLAASRSSPTKGYKSYASASFHGLAASCSGSTDGTGSFGNPRMGGGAYWFEQITISSPSVPAGTIGTADFTLYFDGDLAVGEVYPEYQRENSASIGYRWSIQADGADNVADPNTGESFSELVLVNGSYKETIGGNFRRQPRHHQATFRFGEPFDFTVQVTCRGTVWEDSKTKARAAIRCAGWNGFRNVQVRFGDVVTDATITSQSGFNYATPSTISYPQWAGLYQLTATSMQEDSNGNGLPNLLEYALGRDPLSPDSGPVLAQGVVNVGGTDYQSFTFTRPCLGARPTGIVYLPQRSDGLGGWSTTGVETTVAPSTTDTETVTVRSTQPLGSQASEFLRLEVTGP